MFHTNDESPVPNKIGRKGPVSPRARQDDKASSRSASFDSSDSDSDNESKHLSLKHISNSVKRISEEKQRNVKKFPKLKPKISESESEQEVKKVKKTKLECEKCKKKFSTSVALEYHRITFHVESGTSSPSPGESKTAEKTNKRKSVTKPAEVVKKQKISPDKRDTNKSKCLTGIFRKTQKQSDHSEDDSKQVIENIKSKLFMMQQKTFSSFSFESRKRQSVNYKDSSSSESPSDQDSESSVEHRKDVRRKVGKKSSVPRSRSIVRKDSETSSDEEIVAKKSAKKGSKEKPRTIESEFQSHSIDAILRSKYDVKGSKNNKSASKLLKSSSPSVNKSKTAKVTSDSEPEIVKKEIKTEPVVDIVDSEDESSKIRERLFTTTSVKEKCENCNKNFKNLLTLRYHQLHCDVSNKMTSSASKNSVEKSILYE